ncbi:glycosyltransferase [Paracoccus marcusii]|uniref:glycosyltransferase n=1 Tax=Paracoccus marcusii TaxID=59779 RepID=UPI0024936110|nr:glycosyltransferase [Paracoccus marcusii]
MSNLVIGFCRFSFLGRGDWSNYRSIKPGEENNQLFREIAKEIYEPERMARRFSTFEKITIPSIMSQSEKKFRYVVISSSAMPDNYKDRLKIICGKCSQIELIFAESKNLSEEINPVLNKIKSDGDHAVQFRLDDDDAISRRYVELVYEHSERFKDLSAYAITFNKGISAVSYPDSDVWYAEYKLPFQSASAIVKFSHKNRNIFNVGHFAIQRSFTHLQDVENYGAFMMKWPSDSREINRRSPPSYVKEVERNHFNEVCRVNFPGLENLDFNFSK